jgi:hypothetical protein
MTGKGCTFNPCVSPSSHTAASALWPQLANQLPGNRPSSQQSTAVTIARGVGTRAQQRCHGPHKAVREQLTAKLPAAPRPANTHARHGGRVAVRAHRVLQQAAAKPRGQTGRPGRQRRRAGGGLAQQQALSDRGAHVCVRLFVCCAVCVWGGGGVCARSVVAAQTVPGYERQPARAKWLPGLARTHTMSQVQTA